MLPAQGLSAAAVMKQGAGESATTLLSYVSHGVTSWAGNSVATVLFSMVVPAMFLGARLADTDLLAHPERHRRLLAAIGLGGLGIGGPGRHWVRQSGPRAGPWLPGRLRFTR